jgi:hypothetical protein
MLAKVRGFISRHRILSTCAGLLLIAFVSLALFYRHARVVGLDLQCKSKCKWNIMEILTYEDRHRHLPPAHIDGPDGSRWHSWRAVIAPEDSFTSQYDFHEPWNGPNNSKLRDHKNHRNYVCPSASEETRKKRLTNYFVVEGAKTAFPGANTISMDNPQYARGRSNTIVMVEAHGLEIEWLEPRDLDINTMSFLINDPKRPGISGPHPHGPHVCMADGRYQSLSNISPDILKAMLSIPEEGIPGAEAKESK